MTKFIISGVVLLLAIVALGLTIKIRKKMEFPIFLFLIAFESLVILATGWMFVIYGAIVEMGNM